MKIMKLPSSYDVIGSIAILKFKEGVRGGEKKKVAEKLLKERKNIKTVVEKVARVKGRLRTIKTKHLAGVKNLFTVYVESGCRFKLNIETCYFSPRLSSERLDVARKIKKKDNVLVMFAGVAPYSIVIAKQSKCKKVVSVELGRECSKYAHENVKLNKLGDVVKVVQGDVKKVIKKGGLIVKGNLVPLQFDVIVMPRPQLKEKFLKQAFMVVRKGGKIFYYDFGKADEREKIVKGVEEEAKKVKKKIKITRVKKAGEIAPYKYRWRVDLRVEN